MKIRLLKDVNDITKGTVMRTFQEDDCDPAHHGKATLMAETPDGGAMLFTEDDLDIEFEVVEEA